MSASVVTSPYVECTYDKHVFQHNLCQYCQRATICRNCKFFQGDIQVCKLCNLTLDQQSTENSDGRTDSLFDFEQSRVSDFRKAGGVQHDKETGEIRGFEEFCSKMNLNSEITGVDLSASTQSYTKTTQVGYSVTQAAGGNERVINLTQEGSSEITTITIEEGKGEDTE